MNIDIVLTGGTIATKIVGNSAELAKDFDIGQLTEGKAHSFRQHCPYYIHSEDLVPSHWKALYETIRNIKDTDGIIVLHGTDTLVYTAAFLSFAFADTAYPIILVSSHSPLNSPSSNAKDNFDMAVSAVERRVKGVFVSYKNDNAPKALFAANKIVNFLPFVHTLSAVEVPYAVQEKDFVIIGKPFAEQKIAPIFPVNRVTLIAAAPGTDFSYYLSCSERPDCFLVELYHSSTCNNSFSHFTEECRSKGIKVYAAPYQDRDYYYPSKQHIEKVGIMKGMTLFSAYTKLLISDLTEK
ncbi:MAG: asparaginase domain-containing protein [Clostridia bacterium]|nr:asparaginase domain-containing protein [Clostridia bacterium]